MARRNVKVVIPRNKPEELAKLIDTVLKKHDQDAANSKISAKEATALRAVFDAANALRAESINHRNLSESKMEEANKKFGIGKGQTLQNEGTAMYLITGIISSLKKEFRGNEEKLSEYGFKVTVSTSSNTSNKNKTPKN